MCCDELAMPLLFGVELAVDSRCAEFREGVVGVVWLIVGWVHGSNHLCLDK
jgi:hypothetical protein